MEDLDMAMAFLSTLGGGTAGQDMLDPYGLRQPNYDYMDPYGVYGSDPTSFKAQSQYAVKPNIPEGRVKRVRDAAGTITGAAEAAGGLSEVAKSRSAAIGKGVKGATKAMGFAPTVAGRNGRITMQALKHPALQAGLKWAGPVGAALAAGDLILGDESLANKGMDAALMTAGGVAGSVIPVVGTALGATGGKMISDGLQFVFGGGKSPEERKLEEALALLQRGAV